MSFQYFGRKVKVQGPSLEAKQARMKGQNLISHFRLTAMGEELFKVSGPTPENGYYDFLIDSFQRVGFKVIEQN